MRSSTASKARKFAPTKDRFIYEFAACRIRLVETSALHGCGTYHRRSGSSIICANLEYFVVDASLQAGEPSEITRCGDKKSCPGSKLREEKAEARPADQHEGGELPGFGEREDP
ncbi:hypothetical protein GN958_ATG04680, partial [Phytophthora infestans]